MENLEKLRMELVGIRERLVTGIARELERIGRPVRAEEFGFIPFRMDVQLYIEAVRLDSGRVVVDTSFQDITEKELGDFVRDGEMTHWDLIALYGLLITIKEKGYEGLEDGKPV